MFEEKKKVRCGDGQELGIQRWSAFFRQKVPHVRNFS